MRKAFWVLLSIGITLGVIFGTWIRYSNLFHVGFEFDIITTQYTWGKAVFEMGFVNFWQYYDGYFDYLPGALYVDTVVYAISVLFGGTPEVFATIIKTLNWFVEIVFAWLVYFVARRFGAYPPIVAGGFAVLMYILPSFWFISSIWGQIDSLVVLLSIISLLFLTFDTSNTYTTFKHTKFWAGIFFGSALWIKMQPILLIPVIVVYFLCNRDRQALKRFFSGFVISTTIMLFVPLLTNPERLGYVISAPFTRENVVSRSAASFWTLIQITQRDYLNQGFHPETVFRIISLVGLLLYASISLTTVGILLRTSAKKVLYSVKNTLDTLRSIFYRKLVMQEVFLIATVSTIAYFEFMTKMYARYLHFGTMLAVMVVVMLQYKKPTIIALLAAILLNVGNFINVLSVYVWWDYRQPVWLIEWYDHHIVRSDALSASLTLTALTLFVLTTWTYAQERANKQDRSV